MSFFSIVTHTADIDIINELVQDLPIDKHSMARQILKEAMFLCSDYLLLQQDIISLIRRMIGQDVPLKKLKSKISKIIKTISEDPLFQDFRQEQNRNIQAKKMVLLSDKVQKLYFN